MTSERLKNYIWLLPHLKEMVIDEDMYGTLYFSKNIENDQNLFVWQGLSGNWYIELNGKPFLQSSDSEYLLKLAKTPNYEELLNFL